MFFIFFPSLKSKSQRGGGGAISHKNVSDLSLLQPYLTEIIFLGISFFTARDMGIGGGHFYILALEKSDQGGQYKKIDPTPPSYTLQPSAGRKRNLLRMFSRLERC